MKSISKSLICFFFCCFSTTLVSQVILQPKQVEDQEKGIIYKKERSFAITMHENGFSFQYNSARIPTFYRTNYYMLELGLMRDSREQKQNKNYALTIFSSSRSYVYGKINNLINLRAGVGMKRYISQKARRKGVAVGYNLQGGPSIALLKPYYLDLIYIVDQDSRDFEIVSERYSEENAEKFLTDNDIYGSSGYFKGFSDISIVPGIQGKAGLHFSLGAYDKYVKALEVGIMGDLFIKKIPILVQSENISNKPYFLKLYLKLEFGVRRNN